MRAILTYHSIDSSGSVISLPPEVFAEHVAWFASGKVQVVHLEELLALPAAANAVAITFDDAFTSVATHAAPLLAAHGLPATCFVVTRHAGGDNRWGGKADPGIPVLPIMDWSSLGALGTQGFRLGAHSRNHRYLPRCTDAELRDELDGSREDLAQYAGVRASAFAYPYGTVDARVASAARSVFAIACTTAHRPLSKAPARDQVPRLDAWYFSAPGALEGWGTRRFTGRVLLRHALRTVRRALR